MLEGSGVGWTQGGVCAGGFCAGAAGGEVTVPSSASRMPHHSSARAGAVLGVQLCAGEPSGLGKLKGCSDPHVWGTLHPTWGSGFGLQSPTASGGVAPAGAVAGDPRA